MLDFCLKNSFIGQTHTTSAVQMKGGKETTEFVGGSRGSWLMMAIARVSDLSVVSFRVLTFGWLYLLIKRCSRNYCMKCNAVLYKTTHSLIECMTVLWAGTQPSDKDHPGHEHEQLIYFSAVHVMLCALPGTLVPPISLCNPCTFYEDNSSRKRKITPDIDHTLRRSSRPHYLRAPPPHPCQSVTRCSSSFFMFLSRAQKREFISLISIQLFLLSVHCMLPLLHELWNENSLLAEFLDTFLVALLLDLVFVYTAY